jgi:hypothetical protein
LEILPFADQINICSNLAVQEAEKVTSVVKDVPFVLFQLVDMVIIMAAI